MADDEEFLRELSEEAAASKTIPTDRNMSRLQEMGSRMVALEEEIADLEQRLKNRNVELWDLKTRDMPGLMNELDVDHVGLRSSEYDLELRPLYHANIKAEWPEEQREAGFAELDRLGGGDIVKNVVSLRFSRGQAVLTQAFMQSLEHPDYQELLRDIAQEIEPGINDTELPPREMARSVQWNTLTAYVKEQVERGTVLDLEKLGATVGQIVTMKKRK